MPTLTVDQPTLDKLERLAAERGLSAARWLAEAVGESEAEDPREPEEPDIDPSGVPDRAAPPAPPRSAPIEEWLDWFAERHARPTGHPVDDSRDSIYEPPQGL